MTNIGDAIHLRILSEDANLCANFKKAAASAATLNQPKSIYIGDCLNDGKTVGAIVTGVRCTKENTEAIISKMSEQGFECSYSYIAEYKTEGTDNYIDFVFQS